MTTPLRRRQVLGLGFAALGTAVAAPAVWNRLQRFPAAASPAGAATLASGGGVAELELELVAQALPGPLPVGPAELLTYNGRPESQRCWKHTVLVKAGEEVRLRVTCRDFSCRTVYHCQNLDHGDMGLMGVLQIDGPAS